MGRGPGDPFVLRGDGRILKHCLVCPTNSVCSTILTRPLILKGGGCPKPLLCMPCTSHVPSVCPSIKPGLLHSNKLPSETFAPRYFLYWFCFHNKYICNTNFHMPTANVDLFFRWRIIFVYMCHFVLRTEG